MLYKRIISLILVVFMMVCIVGCSGQPTKEDIVYKVISYAAQEYGEDTEDIILKSGSIREDAKEEGVYDIWAKVSVYSNTLYFTGTYNTKTGEIDYNDNTALVKGLLANDFPVGDAYLETESFDISKVNQMLRSK